LATLSLIHAKTVEELGQAARQLAWVQSELERRPPPSKLDSQRKAEEEELSDMRLKLAKVTSERDRQKAELQLARQQSHIIVHAEEELSNLQAKLSQARAERDQLKGDLHAAKRQGASSSEQESPQQLREQLSETQEQLRVAQACQMWAQDQLAPKDAEVQKLQKELRLAQKQVAQRQLSEILTGDAAISANDEEREEQELETMALQKAVSGYSAFINRVINTSARPVLHEALDMSDAQLLGMGHYGYVMTCKTKGSHSKVVLKLQDIRWVDVAVREWAHGEELGKHPHIVDLKELLMHSDSDHSIQDRIAAFNGASGVRTKWYPNAYVCLVSEYMDCGSVCSLMEKQLLTLEGVCAVTRQVASALVFMHQRQRSHNDVRVDGIMLKRAAHGGILQVKLADAGWAEQTTDHYRDRELLAYAIWCMVVGREFTQCPARDARLEAMAEFQKAPLLGRRATARGSALIESVIGLWEDQLDIPLVCCNAEFQGCEVREPEAPENKVHLTTSANIEVTKRASVQLERFQESGHRAPLANSPLDDGTRFRFEPALSEIDEGSQVLDSRDE